MGTGSAGNPKEELNFKWHFPGVESFKRWHFSKDLKGIRGISG